MREQTRDATQMGDGSAVHVAVREAVHDRIGLRGSYIVICRGKDGRVKWRDTIENLVTNAGEDYMLDIGLSGGTQITSWFLGLTDGTPTAAEGVAL